MRCRSNAVLALSASVVVTLGLALVPSAATAHTGAGAGAAAVKVPKIKSVKLDLDVAGYVEVRQLVDTTDKCSPGVTYTQTNEYTFETGKYLGTRLVHIAVPGTDAVLTGAFSRAAGSANITGGLTGYRTTNYCAPTKKDPEPLRPTCLKTRGKTRVALVPAAKQVFDVDDLVPLDHQRMMLTVLRSGGAWGLGSCSGARAIEIFPSADTSTAYVTTSWHPGVSLVLPTGLGSVKLFNLKKKDRLQRSINLAGPCDSVRVNTLPGSLGGAPAGQLNADGDCWVRAKIVLSVRRSL